MQYYSELNYKPTFNDEYPSKPVSHTFTDSARNQIKLDLIWPQPQSMLGYQQFHIMPRFSGT